MELFNQLLVDDVELIRGYINRYGGSYNGESYLPADMMPHFLRYWSKNKAPLYEMFGQKFILRKEVSFDRDPEQMADELDETIRYSDPIAKAFRAQYDRFIWDLHLNYDDRYELRRFACDCDMLAANEYNGAPFVISGDLTIDNRPLQINTGVKAVKMLGKICKALGFSVTAYKCPECGHVEFTTTDDNKCSFCGHNETPLEKIDGYEAFRRTHSLILNQKKIRGTMCLSIHPLDYITMSDNDCGWQSCMQWMEEAGDYRLGTIEMMNSAYCVVAYVEARETMPLWSTDTRWSNKRWRQLLMITPEMLLGNKQYPYFSDNLQGTALKWLRDLANAGDYRCVENHKRYGPYEEEALQIVNNTWNNVGTEKVYVKFWFDYMYNDIYDQRMAFIVRNWKTDRIEYNLSGPAVCTNCGADIYYDDEIEPSWTVCRNCSGEWRCASCGEWHCGEPYYAADNDSPYCEYCYETYLDNCEVCGDRVVELQHIYIEILPNADEEHEFCNWNYVIDSCRYCVDSTLFNKLYGPIHYKEDMYGRNRKVVKLDNITDEGLEHGSLGHDTREMLKTIRDAESYEERLALVRKNLY